MININRLNAFVGGYAGVSYEIKIDFNTGSVDYSVYEYGESLPEDCTAPAPSRDALERFKKNLFRIKIFEWNESYENNYIIDGTGWSVEIETDSGNYSFEGSNAYPETWRRFCRSVERLTGREFR